MLKKKKITICADDFALSPGIDDAIISLAEKHKISAISCLSVSERWKSAGVRLQDLKGVQVGLHLCFSNLKPLTSMPRFARKGSMPSLRNFLVTSPLGLVDGNEIRNEIEAQIDAFTEVIGKMPQFIDGHQHLHQFCPIRTSLLEVLEKKGWRDCLIRNSALSLPSLPMHPGLFAKKAFLNYAGEKFRDLAVSRGLRTNSSLSGVYRLDEDAYSESLFFRFLHEIQDHGILVCHPALNAENLEGLDDYRHGRVEEFKFLSRFVLPPEIQLV